MKFGIRHWVIFGSTFFLAQAPLAAQTMIGRLPRLPIRLEIAQNSGEVSEPATETAVGTGVTDLQRLEAIQFYNAGVDKLTSGDYLGAITEFSNSIAIDPTDPDSFYNRGYSYHILGEYQAAYDDYGNAVALNPEFADAYGNRCYAAYLLENYEEALDSCEAAIELKDDNPDFFINRGNTYDDLAVVAVEADDLDLAAEYSSKAIADYDAAIVLKPDHAKAYYNRALAYNRLGDHQAAAAD